MKVYMDCPKCNGDIAFYFIIEPDGAIIPHLDRAVEQGCDCELSDAEMERLTEQAIEKAADPDYNDPTNDIDFATYEE